MLSDPENEKTLTPEEIRSYKLRARTGFLWVFSTTVIWQIVSWALTLLTARILLAEDYGLLALSETVIGYLLLISVLRLDAWLIQADRFDEDTQGSILSLALGLSLACTGMLVALAPFVAAFYGRPELTAPLAAMSIIFIPRGIRAVSEARLRRELRVEPIAVSNLVIGITRGLLQLVLAYFGWRYWALVAGNIFGEIAQAIWMAYSGGLPRRLRWNRELNSVAVKFGLSAVGSTVFWIFFSTADKIVIGKIFGMEVLGYYAMAFYLTELPLSKINFMLLPVISPYYSKLRNNAEELYSSFLMVSRTVVGVVAPVLVGLALVAPEFVRIFLGDHWLPMILPLQVLSIVCLLRSMTANASTLLLAIGRPNANLLASAVPGLILPPLFYAAGIWAHMTGIYFVWLFIYPFFGPLLYFAILSRVSGHPLEAFLLNVRAPVVSVAVMAAVLTFFETVAPNAGDTIMLGAKVIIGAATYFATFVFLFREEMRESLRAFGKAKS